MSKKIIIHAGPGKTGTSAIQAWLCQHQNELKNNKILYPNHDVGKHEVSSGNFKSILKCQQGNWSIDDTKLNKLVDNFHESNYEVLLLSSEHFYNLIEDFNKLIPQAEFLIYFRNPVEILESNYNQGVKRHGFSHKFNPPTRITAGHFERFSSLLNLLGSTKLHVRSYETACNNEGGVVKDFVSSLGFNVNINKKRINSSYTLEALELKRLLNNYKLGNTIDHRIDKLLQGYVKGVSQYSLIAPELYKSLQQDCVKHLELLIQQYNVATLMPLLAEYKCRPQKNFFKQQATEEELNQVLDFIRISDVDVYNSIRSLLSKQVYSPSESIVLYNSLGLKTPAQTLSLVNDKPAEALIASLPIADINKSKVASKFAHYFEEQGDVRNAMKFLSSALSREPENTIYIDRFLALNDKIHSNKGRLSLFITKLISAFKNKK